MIKDFSSYTNEQWLELIKFIAFHIDILKKGKAKPADAYNITEDKIDILKRLNSEENHPWIPFIGYLDPFSEKYIYRIRNFVAIALQYLKSNPSLITEEMKVLMLKSPVIMGKYIVDPQQLPPALVIDTKGNPVVTLQSKQMDIIVDSVEYLQRLIREAKKRDVSELSLKDILSAMPKIVDAINKMQNRQVKVGNLTQINLNGSAQDIEEGMLAMLKSNEE